MMPSVAAVARFGPSLAGLRWAATAGGFSGAAVWRGVDADGTPRVALKAYPPGTTSARLADVHGWQRRAAERLPSVPRLFRTSGGNTFTSADGRFWDASTWVPGTADFHAHPSAVRLANACEAVAAVHRVWRPDAPPVGPAPAVRSRLAVLADVRGWLAAGGRPVLLGHPPLDDAIARGLREVERLAPSVERALRPWASVPMTLQPCLRDVWHDHVLFTADAVTGLVDFAAARVDTPATDLARLLGSFVPDDDAAFAVGLRAYGADVDGGFVRLLARTGVVGAVAGWLVRLFVNRQPVADFDAVAGRVSGMVGQLERFSDRSDHWG